MRWALWKAGFAALALSGSLLIANGIGHPYLTTLWVALIIVGYVGFCADDVPAESGTSEPANEPIAWVNESFRDSMLEKAGKVYWHQPMMCGKPFKGAFPVYLGPPLPSVDSVRGVG